jgi:hypothetical protein
MVLYLCLLTCLLGPPSVGAVSSGKNIPWLPSFKLLQASWSNGLLPTPFLKDLLPTHFTNTNLCRNKVVFLILGATLSATFSTAHHQQAENTLFPNCHTTWFTWYGKPKPINGKTILFSQFLLCQLQPDS